MYRQFRLFDRESADEIASRLTDWGSGRARNEDLTGSIKQNLEIVPVEGQESYALSSVIMEAISQNKEIVTSTMLYRLTAPKFNKYTDGGSYGRHFDASPMGGHDMRTDFSCTVFLNDGYEGGELNIETEAGTAVVPPGEPGTCVVYECGRAHWVSPVTKGERIAAICWFRSLVRDPRARRLLSDFRILLDRWESDNSKPELYGDEYTTLTGIHTELCRMWVEA